MFGAFGVGGGGGEAARNVQGELRVLQDHLVGRMACGWARAGAFFFETGTKYFIFWRPLEIASEPMRARWTRP